MRTRVCHSFDVFFVFGAHEVIDYRRAVRAVAALDQEVVHCHDERVSIILHKENPVSKGTAIVNHEPTL